MFSKRFMVALFFVTCMQAFSEDYVPKKAGVSFRFDDNHSVKAWKPMIEIFDKHGLKAGLSINSGLLKDPALAEFFKKIQENGHEIMNHTPYHRYYVLRFPDAESAKKYENRPGVDHVRDNFVCFKYTAADKPPKPRNTAQATITKDGKIKFEESKHVRGFYTASFYMKPYNKTFYLIGRKADSDGYYQLLNIWREPVTNVAPLEDATCVFESRALKLSPDAFMIEGEVAHAQFAKWGIKQPVTWINPGCGEPLVHGENIKKSYGDKYNYTSGAVYVNTAAKLFNEYDPDDTRRFAMQWGNFRSESSSLEKMQTVIADSIACNRVAFDASHMRGVKNLGGQEAYLKRIDDLLTWLKENNIPVKTQSEWAEILYLKKPDPKTNAFPSINTDLDGNDRPDGIFPGKDTKVVKLENNETALQSTAKGVICKVNKLGGLEKGINRFDIDFKADKGANVTVHFAFNRDGKKSLVFTGNGEWQQSSEEIDVPLKASYANVTVSTNSNSPVHVRGITLSK